MRFANTLTLTLTLAAALLMPTGALAQSDAQVVELSGPGDGTSVGGDEASGIGPYRVQGDTLGIMSIGFGATAAEDVNAIINAKMPASLEEAIERAMKDNPEIGLAVANRRQAEMAENLTRNKVTQSVVQTYKQWQFDQRTLERVEAAHQAASISEEELLIAKEAVMRSETSLQFLLGGYTVQHAETRLGVSGMMQMMGGGKGSMTGAPSGTGAAPVAGESGGGGLAAPGGGAGYGGVGAPMAGTGDMAGGAGGSLAGMGTGEAPPWKFNEKLAEKSGPIHYVGLPIEDFAKLMTDQTKAPVIVDRQNFEASGGLMNFQITLSLDSEALTWNDVLTAIADTHQIGFVKRDYGLLITTKANAAASGGLSGGFIGGFGGFGGAGGLGGGGGGGGAF